MPNGKLPVSSDELRRLYVEENWTLSQIAGHFGVTKQGVHFRLKRAGVARREPGGRKAPPDRELIEHLYCVEGLPKMQIAERLGISQTRVYEAFKIYGITRPKRRRSRKYPEIQFLKLGESITLPRPEVRNGLKWHPRFYALAAWIGIRVSVAAVDEKTAKITRIE